MYIMCNKLDVCVATFHKVEDALSEVKRMLKRYGFGSYYILKVD